ncbi:6567_t:CDS:2, partial [Scutellospora calospora]
FENITKLEGHHGEVWALAISKRGDLLISGSHDRSIRVWEQTDEQKELEELYDSTLTTSMEKATLEDNRGQDPGPPPKPNPILVTLGNLTGDQYVLRIIEKIRSSELEEALLILLFAKVISLFHIWTCRLK